MSKSPMTCLGIPDGAFLPDLTLWRRSTGKNLESMASELGVPVWQPERPWKMELPGIGVENTETGGERLLRWTAPSGSLQSKWVRGPDGDWWQSEYPVKSADDFAAALEIVQARRYAMFPVAEPHAPVQEAGGLSAFELPMRPFLELVHVFLGWSEGQTLLYEQPDAVRCLLEVLESRMAGLVRRIAALPGGLALSPDNLDGSFVSPAAFDEHLAASYRSTAEVLHAAGKGLVVHVGGMSRGLLAGLAAAGIDAIEGACGPPQSDAGLAEARALCGPDVVLWGGLAQDWLLAAHNRPIFEAAARAALKEVQANGPALLGVADRVPAEALPERLAWLADLVRTTMRQPSP
jgi:hypothetical protein